MSEIPTKIIVDCTTGITVELPLTASEIAERDQMAAAAAEEAAEREAAAISKAAAKESARAKFVALGLTDEEIAALVG